MALGAEAGRVQAMVIRQGIGVVLVGVGLGLVAALASTRALGSLLYGGGPADTPTFLVMSVAMVVIGAFASYLPARRASLVDPIESLRSELALAGAARAIEPGARPGPTDERARARRMS